MTELPPSPFLQRCYMAFESASQLFFVLDLVGGGDLFYHLVQKISENGWGFPEDQARVLLAEVRAPRIIGILSYVQHCYSVVVH